MWPGPIGILSYQAAYLNFLSDIYPAVWPQETWAENRGLCPLFGGLGPHRTD